MLRAEDRRPMSATSADVVSATSILLGVCLVVLLTLLVICRLLRHGTFGRQTVAGYPPPPPPQDRCADGTRCRPGPLAPSTADEPSCSAENRSSSATVPGVTAEYTGLVTGDHRRSSAAAVNADGASEEATWLALHSPGGAIQRALSCDSVISESSIADLEHADDVNNKIGQIEFSLQYLRVSTELMVTVIQARDLERDHVTGSLDSYVRVSLSPFTGSRSQTRIVRDTLCPQFIDSFVYRVPPDLLQPDCASSPVVQFQAFSCDKYARHRLLGEAELRLADVDLHSEEVVRIWLNLHEIDERPLERGDVLLSLSYLPTAERLILVIVKARNLSWPTAKPVGGPDGHWNGHKRQMH